MLSVFAHNCIPLGAIKYNMWEVFTLPSVGELTSLMRFTLAGFYIRLYAECYQFFCQMLFYYGRITVNMQLKTISRGERSGLPHGCQEMCHCFKCQARSNFYLEKMKRGK